MVSDSLPAIGAAVPGVRMRGVVVGAAERGAALAAQATLSHQLAQDGAPVSDGLRRLLRRTAGLLTADVSQRVRAARGRSA